MIVEWPRLLCRRRMLSPLVGMATALLTTNSVSAQGQQLGSQPDYSVNLSIPNQSRPPVITTPQQQAGHVAASSVGTAGQRQNIQQMTNIKPMARLDTRIANRVESRIRNRIDRSYNPQANTTSPFKVAADQDQTNALAQSSR